MLGYFLHITCTTKGKIECVQDRWRTRRLSRRSLYMFHVISTREGDCVKTAAHFGKFYALFAYRILLILLMLRSLPTYYLRAHKHSWKLHGKQWQSEGTMSGEYVGFSRPSHSSCNSVPLTKRATCNRALSRRRMALRILTIIAGLFYTSKHETYSVTDSLGFSSS